MEAHVAEYKKRIVDDFVKLIKDYPIVGAVNMEGMPTAQLQKMREEIRKKDIVLIMTKRRLLNIALENAKNDKKGIEELKQHLKGMPALIFSKENPFKLYKLLSSSKSKAPAKAGQTAPNDIVVKAGGTSFAPGPIISELAAFGIKSGVEGGKVAIKEDTVVCKEGDKIDGKLAEILTRLGIEPMEVGLDLVAVYEDGFIFKKDVLSVDEQEYIDNITKASQEAFNLSVETGYFTKENVEVIIRKVFSECKALAEESKFMADVVVEDMLASAERAAKSVKAEGKIETEAKVEEVKPEVKEEPKPEEKPAEEAKPEAPKQEAPVEEKKEEPKPEQKVEEAKPEVKEEQKSEEKPVEAPKVEETKPVPQEEKKKEEASAAPEEKKDESVSKIVNAYKKHASGEDKKESASALLEDVGK